MHVDRQRLEYPYLKRHVIEMAKRKAARSVLIEDKASGTQLIQDLRAGRYGVRPIAIEPEKDKITRMSNYSAVIEAGNVLLPAQAPWLDEFKSEMLAFPYGRFNDQVDSVSQFLNWTSERRKRRWSSGRQIGYL
jgi:predicted phage terminase large subunit-like protein